MGIVGNVIIMKLKVVSDKFEISILLVNFYLKFFFYRVKWMCYGIFKVLCFMWIYKSGGNKL